LLILLIKLKKQSEDANKLKSRLLVLLLEEPEEHVFEVFHIDELVAVAWGRLEGGCW
jgi:hypothetical protein